MTFDIIDGYTVQEIIDDSRNRIVDIVQRAYIEHGSGLTNNPRSHFLRFSDSSPNRIIALPAYLEESAVAGIKWISSFPDNIRANKARASSVLILNNAQDGYPIACLEASYISASRTAASAVAAAEKVLDIGDVKHTLFIGAGVLSRTIAEFLQERGWMPSSTSVYDLNSTYSAKLASYINRMGHTAKVSGDYEKDFANADLVIIATTASTPWIREKTVFKPGQCVLHISLRDIAPEILLENQNVVDDIDHCLTANTSTELALNLSGNHEFITTTIPSLLTEAASVDDTRSTIVSPFGLGVLDLAVAAYVHARARELGRTIAIQNFFGGAERWRNENH